VIDRDDTPSEQRPSTESERRHRLMIVGREETSGEELERKVIEAIHRQEARLKAVEDDSKIVRSARNLARVSLAGVLAAMLYVAAQIWSRSALETSTEWRIKILEGGRLSLDANTDFRIKVLEAAINRLERILDRDHQSKQ
jgi:hypothetical protein